MTGVAVAVHVANKFGVYKSVSLSSIALKFGDARFVIWPGDNRSVIMPPVIVGRPHGDSISVIARAIRCKHVCE